MILHKHYKAKTTLQIKNTCKSWYLRIASAKILFREIAFDTSEVSTLGSAQACLRLLGRGSKVPLLAFIAGSEGDMDKFTRLRHKIVLLLGRLSKFSQTIIHCQVWDPSNRMCEFLKGHAPALEFLSIGVTGQTSVFSGPLPNLRSAVITTSNSRLWRASVFPALSNLSLAYAGDPTGTSLRALVDLLESLPKLQNLHLDNFRDWVPGKRFLPRSVLVSTSIHKLSFKNCDISAVLYYLHLPNLRSFLADGTHSHDDNTPLPLFQDPGLLPRIQAAPIFKNHRPCAISIIARQEPTKRSLVIKISGNGRNFSAHLEWLTWRSTHWELWVNALCGNLLQRSKFSSSISLTVDLDESSLATFHQTLLSLLPVETLIVAGGSLCEILRHLEVFERRFRFPALKHLDLTAYTSLTTQEGDQIRTYLQFRVNGNNPVMVVVQSCAWSGARRVSWTSLMNASSIGSTTTLAL